MFLKKGSRRRDDLENW